MKIPVSALLWLVSAVPAVAQEVSVVQDEDVITPKGRGVQLTRPDGTPIYVNPHAIAFIRKSLPTEGGNATIVFASGATQAVIETVDEIVSGIHIEPVGPKDEDKEPPP